MIAMTSAQLTRREYLYYLWAAAAVILIVLALVISFYFIRPRQQPVAVANLADVEPGKPLFHPVDRNLAIYLVRTQDRLQVWDAVAPNSGCRIVWVAFNSRFEDPCSGAKWCADGTHADLRHGEATTLRRYEHEVTPEGEILVYPLRKIDGEPLATEMLAPYPRPFAEAIVECPSP